MEARQSTLFTIRIWSEEDGTGEAWRGQVEHVLSGERLYFRDWNTLVEFLQPLAHTPGQISQENTEDEAGGRCSADRRRESLARSD